jgi:hypothetical protein
MLATETKWREFHVGTGTLELHQMKWLILGETGYFGQYGVQCTIGCSRFTSNRETENVGQMAEKLGSR